MACPTIGDFCSKSECAALKREINGLKADIQVLRMAIDRHAKQSQSEHGGAHPWSGSKPGQGKNGRDGKNGKDGKNGRDGKNGKDGKTPVKGRDYFDGKNGKDGKDGKNGTNGKNGKNGRDGKNGKDGKTPVKGRDYFDGARGPIGPIGPKGDKGDTGAIGPKGDKGDMGPFGPMGLPGRDGRNGKDGKNGKNGATGAMGPMGARGATGAPGKDGKDGRPGATGPRGATGAPGAPGQDATIDNCSINLTWDAINNNLKAEITINTCQHESTVKIDMQELIDLLRDIQEKVTIEASILGGQCVEPASEGDWYQYEQGSPTQATGFQSIFQGLSQQIENIHKDTCKAVQHKIPIPELPPPITCSINPETGEMQVQSMSTEQMGLIGLIPPWVIPSAGGAVVSWLTEKVLDWLFKSHQEQQKHTYELLCNGFKIDVPIKKGECVEPDIMGDWYEYEPAPDQTVNNLSDAFKYISEQLENIHKDTCKGVNIKLEKPPLPVPHYCKEETVYSGAVGDMVTTYTVVPADNAKLALMGWTPPWEIAGNSEKLTAAFINNEFAKWTAKFDQDANKLVAEENCIPPITPPEEPIKEVIGCLPKIKLDSNGNPLINLRNVYIDGELVYWEQPQYQEPQVLEIRRAYSSEITTLVTSRVPEQDRALFALVRDAATQRFKPENPDLMQKLFDLDIACKEEATDSSCTVLLPDPSAVWNTEGYYIFFHWKIENPTTDAERNWSNLPTQLASPIDELINPADPAIIWDRYFKNIYKILGNQWGELRSKNKAKRYPLYKGWFADKNEARRFFNSIKPLTTIEADNKNNPSFPDKDSQSVRLVYQGKKFVLRKVCVGLKHIDTDKTDILQTYAPPR